MPLKVSQPLKIVLRQMEPITRSKRGEDHRVLPESPPKRETLINRADSIRDWCNRCLKLSLIVLSVVKPRSDANQRTSSQPPVASLYRCNNNQSSRYNYSRRKRKWGRSNHPPRLHPLRRREKSHRLWRVSYHSPKTSSKCQRSANKDVKISKTKNTSK